VGVSADEVTTAGPGALSSPAVRRAVAIGGGTGLPNVLACLLELGYETTAVVTVADDGGSSGHLRRELGMPPPGDARNCLVAMADPDGPVARLFQYRFPHGEGLIIAAFADIEGSFPRALEDAATLLGSRGRVLPSTLDDVVLSARDVHGGRVVGQVAVAENAVPIATVRYEGPEPDVYPPAAEALKSADLVVIGPGSLYTSILPNFIVGGLPDALRESGATVVYVCNVANQRGETGGMDAADHVRALVDHGLGGVVDVVFMHDSDAYPIAAGEAQAVPGGRREADLVRAMGMDVLLADFAAHEDPLHHSRPALLAALAKAV
jgi:uncharacterized cofD-like protein